jgi:acyl-CoA reductase-like NAD-dependent aldehyde dehydrogenase
MTADQLRTAGFTEEASRLDRARAQADAWAFRPADRRSDTVLALSVFGSRRYDELATALNAALPDG